MLEKFKHQTLPTFILLGEDMASIDHISKLPVNIVLMGNAKPKNSQDNLHFISLKKLSNAERVDLIIDTYRTMNCTGAVSFQEGYQDILYTLSTEFQINTISKNAIYNSRNKIVFRQTLEKFNLNNVPFAQIKSIAELEEFRSKLGEAVILKPSKGAGSYRTILLEPGTSINEFPEVKVPWMLDDEYPFIAEKYISGKEYSVETLTINGAHSIVAIVERRVISDSYFIGKGHITPTTLSDHVQKAVGETVKEMLTAIELDFGPAHTEIKISGDEICIIETQIRSGGASIWKLVELTTGINVQYEIISHLTNCKVDRAPTKFSHAGVCYLHSKKGRFMGIIDEEGILKDESVVDYHLYYSIGEKLPEILDSFDRTGYVICGGTSYDSLSEKLHKFDQLTILTKETSSS
ncbi:MAG: ATP-grasp domain-containing protein [Crocinitomicaceae bacterium]|nr:ATP-grasp domain-containing protein [Crocinitomicaceae bacterium]